MELNRLAEIMDSSVAAPICHNQNLVWVESLQGSAARIKYVNSEKTATVPVSELVEPDMPDLDEEYPTGLITRISPVIRA